MVSLVLYALLGVVLGMAGITISSVWFWIILALFTMNELLAKGSKNAD